MGLSRCIPYTPGVFVTTRFELKKAKGGRREASVADGAEHHSATHEAYLVEHEHLYKLADDREHSEARVLNLGELQPLLLRRALLVEALRALRFAREPRPTTTTTTSNTVKDKHR